MCIRDRHILFACFDGSYLPGQIGGRGITPQKDLSSVHSHSAEITNRLAAFNPQHKDRPSRLVFPQEATRTASHHKHLSLIHIC